MLNANEDAGAPIWQPSFPIAWDDSMRLGYAPIDDIHQEFIDVVSRLQVAVDDDLPDVMEELIAHVTHHFDEENRWMEETDFPSRDCHKEQHDAVLKSILEVRALLEAGDYAVCRSLAQALSEWFPGHATYLDSALAHWMFKRNFGGKPVVLHRRNPM